MSDLQNRRYKEVTPEETVERLKKLLKDMDIKVEENWIKTSSVGTSSLRLVVKGTNMGQNGKGMTKEFAMASAYAEFFERLQNNMFRFRIEKPSKELPFSNFPDEKHLSIEELLEKNNSFLEYILKEKGYGNKSKEEQIEFIKELFDVKEIDYASLPYYSVKNKDIEYMPDRIFNYLYGTNGMCAGNSREEALIEGISEILERYVGVRILKERLTLPQIPESYIDKFPKVKQMVEKLKENNRYYFRLVDCSLGGKYPVAALYILEKNTGRFGFKLGAHPDYGIAMERCFTEASQGRDIYEYSKISRFDFYEQDNKESINISKFMHSELGEIPYQIIGENADYEFTQMPSISNLDNKTILKNLVNSILQEGKDILIRDLSVLGFPTFSIAIPGMSEYSYDPECKYVNLVMKMQKILVDFENINLNNIKEITNIMETIVNNVMFNELSLLINLKDVSILPCEQIGSGAKYFLAICYIMSEEYEKAAKILEDLSFLLENIGQNPAESIMVKAVYYYASAMDKLKDHKKAMYYINLLFDSEIAEGIDNSFKDKDKIFVNHYGITKEDYVDNDDDYYLPFMKKLREIQQNNIIDQMKNKEIFE